MIVGLAEPVNSLSHLLAAFGFLVAGNFLVRKGLGHWLRISSLILFTLSLVFLFTMSGVFHGLEPGTNAREVLRRLDHAGIWLLIAGTFTPVHIILFRGFWRWGFLLLIWFIAITGLILKTVYFYEIPEWASVSMFLGLGWLGALSAWKVISFYKDRSISYLVYGALFYTVGAIFDYLKWPTLVSSVVGPHEVFHFFVVLGAYYHWKWVYLWADCPVINRLVFKVSEFPDKFVAKAKGEAIKVEASTLTELKYKISHQVNLLFHHRLPAENIHLKYTKEELLD